MKRILVLTICFALFFCVSACSDNEIEQVKNGKLEFDKGTTVGNAFDNCGFFKSTQWTSFQDQQKRTIVQFEGEIDLVQVASEAHAAIINYQGGNDARVIKRCLDDKSCPIYSDTEKWTIQFIILDNRDFDIAYMGIEYNGRESKVRDDSYIRAIYANKFPVELAGLTAKPMSGDKKTGSSCFLITLLTLEA